jgi:hypothetical protein
VIAAEATREARIERRTVCLIGSWEVYRISIAL